MRISDQMMTNRMIQYMNDNKEKLADLNNQVASGKKYHAYSENPSQVAASQTIRSSLNTSKIYIETANEIDNWMDATDIAFNQIQTALINATTLVERGLSDTMGADERANSIAPELDSILDQLLTTTNASIQDKYIFSGFQVNIKPFSVSATDPDVIEYHGDNGIMNHEIGVGQSVQKNINNPTVMNSMFNAVIRAKNALLNNDMTELNGSLTDLNNAMTSVGDLSATNGARQRQVSSSIDHLELANLSLKNLLSDKEDVNMAEAVAMLTSQETTYKAVLEVGQRAISALNLFDVLQ